MMFKRFVQKFLHHSGYYLSKYKKALSNYQPDNHWESRINDVLACNDNQFIERVTDAGVISGNYQVMHNGIKILLGSYYGHGYTKLLEKSRGVHEPQEERVFAEVLKYIPAGATMIELGSFWAFYSMWFQSRIENAHNFLIEPEYINLLKGKSNFKINGFKGTFINAFAGKMAVDSKPVCTITIDELVKARGIERIHILHSDIQGAELEMLEGAKGVFSAGIVDYVFISTHSNELHMQCEAFLRDYHFEIIASASLNETFSVDGILVAKNKKVSGPEFIQLHLKQSVSNKVLSESEG